MTEAETVRETMMPLPQLTEDDSSGWMLCRVVELRFFPRSRPTVRSSILNQQPHDRPPVQLLFTDPPLGRERRAAVGSMLGII